MKLGATPFGSPNLTLPLLEQDNPAGGDGDDPPKTDDAPKDDPATNDDPKPGDDDPKEPKTTKPQAKVYSQREFNSELRKQLTDSESQLRTKILADLEIEDARNKGELSKVIEHLQAQVNELQPYKNEVEQFRTIAEERYQTAFEKLPDSIKVFAPADDAPIVEKERWLVERALPATEKLGDATPKKGLNANDDPKKEKKSQETLLQEIRSGYSQDVHYRPM